ncbi:MAG: YbhB/YbcL family Raf kinase inhibitor-like protein [Bifidobacterium sp.]|jgi:Raf kinase inhibitor-like YbhB/YbcL family protein|nr:YbhB/YbcL family Raf kinase inhibitor-like protein [Bifidobacterium sp.]
MRVSADFTTVPDEFAAAAPPENLIDGTPVVSFPFYVDGLDPSAQYLHWQLTDPDSIPVCGFEWIHWVAANVPIDALMFDFNDSRALQIPPDFSRTLPSMIPEAVQGRTSAAGRFVGDTDPAVTMRYNGPTPPDKPHGYQLQVWATASPLPGLHQGFWLNELLHALHDYEGALDHAGIVVSYGPKDN